MRAPAPAPLPSPFRLAISLWSALLTWLVVPVSARADQPELAFELVEHSSPATLCASQPVLVDLELRNTGSQRWSSDVGDRVSYHWFHEAGDRVEWDGRRTRFPRSVGPGATVSIRATLVAPPEPGTYVLHWDVVRENVDWLGGAPPVKVQVGLPAFRWEVVESRHPATIPARGQVVVPVTLRNSGCATWSAAAGDQLTYHWVAPDGTVLVREGERTPLPQVEPGDTVVVQANVLGPPREGGFTLVWEPVREHMAWFGNPIEAGTVLTTAAALGWTMVSHETPARVNAREPFEVPIRIRNTGTQTWSHDIGDRLSYRWLAADGQPLELEGARTALRGLVIPDQEVELVARVIPPSRPGPYILQWEPVREFVTWYGPPSDEQPPAAVRVAVDVPVFAWAVDEVDAPRSFWVNRTTMVPVRIRNAGAEVWSDQSGDHLSYHWLDEDGTVLDREGLRTELPADVAPGDSVEVGLRVRAPRAAGRYVLEIEMVREHVSWYGPPAHGQAARFEVTVRWLSSAVGIALLILSVAFVVGARRLSPARRTKLDAVVGAGPVVWTAVGLLVVVIAFAELSGFELWRWAFSLSVSGAILLGLPLLAVPARLRAWGGFVMLAAISLLALADLAYMQFFGSLVPLEAAAASHQLLNTGASIAALMDASFAWLATVPLSGLVVAIAWPRRAGGVSPRRARMAVAGALVAASVPAVVRLYTATTGDLGNRVFSDQNNVGRLGVLNAHLFEIARVVREKSRTGTLDGARRDQIARFHRERAKAAGTHGETAGVARGANLLVIQVEALQQWVIGATHDGQQITPYLNALRQRALYYPFVFDQTSQGRTSDAEYLVLSSQHPLEHGALCFLRDRNSFHTIGHALANAGYTTYSAHPYKRGFWNRAIIHPRYGFERSSFRREIGPGTNVGWGLADGLFFERMLPELERLQQPFFALLITLSLHHPYESFPESLADLDAGAHRGTPLGNYLQAMRYFDRSLEQLMLGLEERGLADDTVIAIYGDHDARLETPPEVLKLAGVERWDPSVAARLERVPLFVVVPGGHTRGTVTTIGGQIDVGPTLLELLGVERPASFIGQPLTPGHDGVAVMPDGSAAMRDRIFVATGRDIRAQGACFDFPHGTRRPRRDCDALEKRAREELDISRQVLDHDLHEWLAQEANR